MSFSTTGEELEEAEVDTPKIYEPTESFDQLTDRLNMFLQIYNESIRGAGMDLVFFKDAMIHLVKVSVALTITLEIRNSENLKWTRARLLLSLRFI